MSYDDEEEIKKLDEKNKQMLGHLVEKTAAGAHDTSAINKELKSQGRIIDNIDKNYNIADANLKKAHFVEHHYESFWGYVKSWFKRKPKNANNYAIDARGTEDKIQEAVVNHELTKEQNEIQRSELAYAKDDEYKDKAYEAIKANINRIKLHSDAIGEELDEQNQNFAEQKYIRNPNEYSDFNKGPSKLRNFK